MQWLVYSAFYVFIHISQYKRFVHSMLNVQCSMLKCSFTLHVKTKNKKFSLKCLAECLHDSCYISFHSVISFNTFSHSFLLRLSGIRPHITYSLQSSFTFEKRNDLPILSDTFSYRFMSLYPSRISLPLFTQAMLRIINL